jgi:hypothetical protein
MRGIVFYIKVSRLSYSWARNIDVKYNSSHIAGREALMQNTIPLIEELYFTSRLLAQLYERNCILHQSFSPSYMRGIVFYE